MNAHVLVIDDDEEIRASLRRSLAFEGFKVTLAADGEEALRSIRDDRPDLAVLDIMMPGLDGLEVVRRLRRADEQLPVIMLTARDAVPDRVAGLEAGADDYLVKPFAFSELLARIRVRLRRREPGRVISTTRCESGSLGIDRNSSRGRQVTLERGRRHQDAVPLIGLAQVVPLPHKPP